jgi:hypothetical protein
MAGRNRCKRSGAPSAGDVNVSRRQAGNQSGRAADEDLLGIDAVFGENPLLLGDPEWHDAGAHGGVADDEFRWRAGGIGRNATGQKEASGNDES